METAHRVNGVVIGLLMGFREGAPLVVFSGNQQDVAVAARSTTSLDGVEIGAQVALVFEDGDVKRPLVIGQILPTAVGSDEPAAARDEKRVSVEAGEQIELRVGKASIVMHGDGRITIRGTRIVSQASGANRIRGGSVHLN